MSLMTDNDQDNDKKPRRRGLTSLTLGWLADRLRRAAQVKEQVEKGQYSVDSEKVAAAIVNKD